MNFTTAENLGKSRTASDWHRVGAGLSVRFELQPPRLLAEWSPRPPTQREKKRVVDRYRDARDLFVTEVARRSGQVAAIVELSA